MALAIDIDRERHVRAAWRLKYLIPSWVLQISMLLGLMGLFAYRLAETVENWEDKKTKGGVPKIELAWEVCNVSFSTLALVLSIYEISRLVVETLTPVALLFTHVVKLVLALGTLAIDITAQVVHAEENYTIIGLAIDCALLLVTILSLAYAYSTWRRVGAGAGDYDELADNPRLLHPVTHRASQQQQQQYRGFPMEDVDVDEGAEFGNVVSISASRDGDRDGSRSRSRSRSTGERPLSPGLSAHPFYSTLDDPFRTSSVLDHNPSVDYASQTAGLWRTDMSAAAAAAGASNPSPTGAMLGGPRVGIVSADTRRPAEMVRGDHVQSIVAEQDTVLWDRSRTNSDRSVTHAAASQGLLGDTQGEDAGERSQELLHGQNRY